MRQRSARSEENITTVRRSACEDSSLSIPRRSLLQHQFVANFEK